MGAVLRRLIVIVYAVLAAGCLIARADTSSPQPMGDITFGTPVSNAIQLGTSQAWHLSLSTPSAVAVEYTPGVSGTLPIQIYAGATDGTGTLVASVQNTLSDKYLYVPQLAAGDYFIVLTQNNAALGTVAYTLNVNPTLSTSSITPPTTLPAGGKTSVFQFSAANAGPWYVLLQKPQPVETIVQLYQGSITGDPLTSSDDDFTQLLNLDNAASGTYYLVVNTPHPTTTTYSCTISVLPSLPVLTLGKGQTGQLTTASPLQVYSVSATAGQPLFVNLTKSWSWAGYLEIHMGSINGPIVAQVDRTAGSTAASTDQWLEVPTVTTGNYYIRLEPFNRDAAVSSTLSYTLTAEQALPSLSSTPTQLTLPGSFSVQWFQMPASSGQPLYAFADHNTAYGLTMTLVQGSLTGTVATQIAGTKDLLLYLPQAGSGTYYLQVSNSTVAYPSISAGTHLPTVTGSSPAQGSIANANDVHWYEVPVQANEQVVLQLDKSTDYANASPMVLTSPVNASAPTGTQNGDDVEFLTPSTDTTYFVRVCGDKGAYYLRAMRTFTMLTPGQPAQAVLAHAGAELWYEITNPANQPLFITTNKTLGINNAVTIYQSSLSNSVAQIGGSTSAYQYFPPQAQATRYIVRERAAATNFGVDGSAVVMANSSLPGLAPGQTVTGTLASQYQLAFYQVALPPGTPITLQGTYPLQLQEPVSGQSINIGVLAGVAGLSSPLVLVVASPTQGSYSVTSTAGLSQANFLYYCNANVGACINLAQTTISGLQFYAGSNVPLGGSDAQAQYLLQPVGSALASGWQLDQASGNSNSLQLHWTNPGAQVTKQLLLTSSAQQVALNCQVSSPRPITFSNALQVPCPSGTTCAYAVPSGPVVTGEYTAGGISALYPTPLGTYATPTQKWVAFWNTGTDEVYGLTFGPNSQVSLSTKGAYTVAQTICPAGQSSYTVVIARPKTDPPYQAIAQSVVAPSLTIANAADARLVPLGTPISESVTVANLGAGSASNVTITCPLPSQATYVAGSASGNGTFNSTTGAVSWNPGNMAAGATMNLTFQFLLAPTMPLNNSIQLSATVCSTEQPQPVMTSCQIIGCAPSLTQVTPAQPGNSGVVTLTVSGSCFTTAATVAFVQGTNTITPTITAVSGDRTQMTLLADLTNQTGNWNLQITNPGGTAQTLPNATAITAGGASEFWCELSGPQTMQLNQWQTINVQYGNIGNVDDLSRLLCVYIPTSAYTVGSVSDDTGQTLASSSQTNSLSGPLVFLIPRVGAGKTHTISIQIQATVARAIGALYPNISLLSDSMGSKFNLLAEQATSSVLGVSADQQSTMNTLVDSAATNASQTWTNAFAQPIWAVASNTVQQIHASSTLSPLLTLPDNQVIGAILDKMIAILQTSNTTYSPLILSRQYTPSANNAGADRQMTGPIGVTSLGYVAGGEALDYHILVRNPVGSTSSVKTVKISEVLDASLDPTTLKLGAIQIGSMTIPASTGTFPVQTYVDLRPAVKSMAQVSVTFTPSTSTLTWTLAGIDPITGNGNDLLLTSTTANGILNQAVVEYTIKPKTALSSGAIIKSQASVTLDLGVPVVTNQVSNALDVTAPTSSVGTLPKAAPNQSFVVQWNGQDEANGSGLVCYSVYVSDNGGPYTCWQNRVTITSAVYTGVMGHSYSFYSIAEDAVGHVQAVPSTYQATIKIGIEADIAKGLHLISLPYEPETADPKAVLGFSENRWASYLPGTGYITYGNDPNQQSWLQPAALVPGRAFWGYWLDEKIVDPVGQILPLSGTYSIPLSKGWNLVGDPWIQPVTWDTAAIQVTAGSQTKSLADAATAGWITDYAWGWVPNSNSPDTGQYTMIADSSIGAATHEIDPWQGYWILAVTDCSLVLPAPAASTGTPIIKATAKASPRRLFDGGWQIRLTAQSASGVDSFNWFGEGTAQQVTKCQRMYSPPASMIPNLQLSFTSTDGDRAIDLREIGTQAPEWRFTVTSPVPGEQITLSWPDLSPMPGATSLVLINETTGERRYLRTTSMYQFCAPSNGSPSTFRIVTVQRGLLRVSILNTSPALRGGGGVQINYQVTEPATVSMVVRTPTGKLVCRIPGVEAPGNTNCSLNWDGCNAMNCRMPSGLYLLEIVATDINGLTTRAFSSCVLSQ